MVIPYIYMTFWCMKLTFYVHQQWVPQELLDEEQLIDHFVLPTVHRSTAAPCRAAAGLVLFGELLFRLDPDPNHMW
jgi:hypothetical protein